MVTQLTNTISSVSGRKIYVSSDDFNATDSLDNRGNSPLRPFKNIQRALLELARYSYVPGFNNDRFSEFTIEVSTGVYFIDNRPGLSSEDEIGAFGFDKDTGKWDEDINVDINDRDNIYWKFNTRDGGCILPRGCSVIGNDLRHVIIKPLYIPDPVDENIPRTSIFNVTGECHFFGFTIRDGEVGSNSPLYDKLSNTGKVYYDKDNHGLLKTPLYSHHKITVFIFAPQNELDLYYKKVAKAFSKYEPTINVEGEFEERIEESRIVGPLSDARSIQSIELQQTPGLESNTNVVITLTVPHDYFEGQFIAIANTGIDDLIEGVFRVYSISSINNKQFTYRVPYASTAIGVGYALDPENPTIIDSNSQPVVLNSNAVCNAEIDTTESASPYVLNCTLRSDWGMCGMWADGLRTSGFKSMVVAQYTGISLQKDDRAFIRYDENTNTWKQASLSSAFSPDVEHTKGDSYWKTDWRTFHIRGSEGAFIQCVSVFAIGQSDHFLMESGADFSITNSNSNFGDTSLHAKGFMGSAFVKDKGGYISHIVPPQELDDSLENQRRVSYYTIDVQNTIADKDNNSKIYIGGDDNTDPYKRPAANVKGQRIGNKYGERLSVRLDPEVVGGTEIFDAEVVPNGFVKYVVKPFNTFASESISGELAKSFDAANLIEANRTLIQEEAFGWMLEKYPELRSSKEVFPDRSDFQTEGERGKLFDAVSLIVKNKRFIQDETLRYILDLYPSLKNTKLFPTDTDGEINKGERESSKCFRDIGFFLDSLTSDLRRGGNREIIDFVDFYKDSTGIVHITNELEETKTAFSYAANMAIAAMRNFTFDIENVSSENSNLNVGDNSGLVVGMNIFGEGIPNNRFVKELIGNDKISIKDENDNPITDISITKKTITFSIEITNPYFNEINPEIDSTITQDSSTNKCISVAQRILSLEKDVLDLFSGEIIDIKDAEDNAITSPCYRDIGYFVDALVSDLKTGGNLRSIKVGETYRTGNSINFIDGEVDETIATYEYAKNVAIASMRNFTVTLSGINTENGSSTVNVGEGNTSGLIVGMRVIGDKDIIPEDTTIKDILNDSEILLGVSGSTPRTGNEVNAGQTNTAVVLTFTAPEFLIWSDERISKDLTITKDSNNPSCNDIAMKINGLSKAITDIIRGRDNIEEIPPSDLSEINSQVGRGKRLDAANLIEANRELIQEEAIERIKRTNPTFRFPNDKDDICKRDIGFLVDALVSDLRIGGNLNTLRIGESYKDGNDIIHITDELEETKEAFEYVGNLAISAMRNFRVTASVTLLMGESYFDGSGLEKELSDGLLVSGGSIPNGTYIRKEYGISTTRINLYTSKDFSTPYEVVTGGNFDLTFSVDDTEKLAYSERSVSTDMSLTRDTTMPACMDIANEIKRLLGAVEAVLANDIANVPMREEPDSNITSQTSRTTIFEVDVSGIGSSDAHNLQTGTPVRLVPRPKFNDSFGRYEKVDPRVVRLPKGFEPNKTYYVIAPGRKTQPYDYSSDAEGRLFGQQENTKLMLAKTKEASIVGLYVYSPEGDSVDPNVEIDLYQFVSDEDYDLERYKCVGFTGSTMINTSIGHNFDIPSTEENATKVFFRTIPGSKTTRLPEVSNIFKFDNKVSRDGRIRDDVEFYVRPIGLKTFSVHLTLTEAINNLSPIAFNHRGEEFNVFFNKKRTPLKYDPSYGKWYLETKSTDDFIIDRLRKRDYSGRLRTTDSWFTRITDNRNPEDRIYRLRYVIPNYNFNVAPPANGFVLKNRRDDFTGLLPQKVLVRGKVLLRDRRANTITITQDEFDGSGFTEENRYDPYRKSSLGDERSRISFDSGVISTIQSARFVEIAGLEYTEIVFIESEVNNSISELKNSTFTTIEIKQPQGGDGVFDINESVTWQNGTAIVQRYIKNESTRKYYLILRDVNGNLENDSKIIFSQGDVTAEINGDPDFGRSISIDLKIDKDLDQYYYSKNNASVYTITPGDTFNDSSGNSFTIESVEDVEDIENTYYIYTSETIQEHIPNQQDGVYYLNILKGDISPFSISAGVANNFKDYRFSQPIGSLYPVDFSNDPLWYRYAGTSQSEKDYVKGLKDPLPTSSVADNFLHGLVIVNDIKRSATKEAIIDLLDNSLFENNSYILESQQGNALSGSEDRLIPIRGDDPYVSRSRLYVELRRYSIARAGNQTFEYLGYGPGNYSTALPIRQQQVKSPLQDFYSQSKKEDGGVVFYTGSDSTGGFYVGNRRFDSITNEEVILESATITSDTEGDFDIITDLVETFISPVTFNENITVLGGNGSDPSVFESPIIVSVQAVDLTQVDYPLIIRSNVNASVDDRLLDRTNFRPLNSGDIVIGKNLIQSASFRISPRAYGQSYSIRTHVINGFASNSTPLSNQSGRLADFGTQSIKSGDIVLRGKNIEEFGSVGWIYTNKFLDSISLNDINGIEFDSFDDKVIVYWSESKTNENQGIIETSEIVFDGFTGDYTFLNGTWAVSKSYREYDSGFFDINDNKVVLEGFIVPEVDNLDVFESISIRVSQAKWKELGVIGAEAIRTETQDLGDYKLGINTLARSNENDYLDGYVNERVYPRFNLDIVGNTLITGESVVYGSNSEFISRTFNKNKNALLVGYDSKDIHSGNFTNTSGLRVSSKDNGSWKVGINLSYDIVDTGYDLLVNGPVQFRSNVFQFPNNISIGTFGTFGSVSIFDKSIDSDANISDPFIGVIDIGNDASIVNISASSESTANEINIGRGNDLSESASIVNIKTSSVDIAGNVRFGSLKTIEERLIFSTEAGEVSLFDSIPSTISLGNAASSISIGSFVGDTVINNRLKVSSEFEISGSITLVGGSDSSSYNVERNDILGTTSISHEIGDVQNTNVDIVILDEDFVLELDYPGGGKWPIGDNTNTNHNIFYFKINTELDEYDANQFDKRISENVRVGDYFLIEDKSISQKEILRVIDVTNLLGDLNGVRSVVIERNPLNVNGLVLPTDPYNDVTTKAKKVSIIRNSSYLSRAIDSNDSIVYLGTFSGSVKEGDYFLLSGKEFVEVGIEASSKSREFKVLEGRNTEGEDSKTLFGVDTVDKVVTIDGDIVNITGDTLNLSSEGMVFSIDDDNPITGDIFRVESDSRTIDICADILRAKIGPTDPYMLNLNSEFERDVLNPIEDFKLLRDIEFSNSDNSIQISKEVFTENGNLNVGDNSDLEIGMSISGDNIPSNRFIRDKVGTDKISVKDENDNPITNIDFYKELRFFISKKLDDGTISEIEYTKKVRVISRNETYLNVENNTDLEVGMTIIGGPKRRFIKEINGNKISVVKDIEYIGIDSDEIQINSGSINFNISDMAFTIPSMDGNVFSLTNNPKKEVFFDTDILGAKSKLLNLVAQDLNIIIPEEGEFNDEDIRDIGDTSSEFFKIIGSEKLLEVNSEVFSINSTELNITGERLNISGSLELDFSISGEEVFKLNTDNKTGKIVVNDFDFNVVDFDISGTELDISSDNVTFSNKNFRLNVDPTGSKSIFSLILDQEAVDDMGDSSPINQFTSDGVDYDINDSDFDIQTTSLVVDSEFTSITSETLDLKVGEKDSYIFIINSSFISLINDKKGSVVFDIGKFDVTSDNLDLEGNSLIISGENLNINSNKVAFSNKDFSLNISPDPEPGNTRKSLLKMVLDSELDPTNSIDIDIDKFDVKSSDLDLDSSNLNIKGALLNIESDKVILENDNLKINITPTGDNSIFYFDSDRVRTLNGDTLPSESIVKFDVTDFNLGSDNLTLTVGGGINPDRDGDPYGLYVNSPYGVVNIPNFTFNSREVNLDIKKVNDKSLVYINSSTDLIKFENVSNFKIDSSIFNINSTDIRIENELFGANLKEISLGVTPDSTKPKLINIKGDSTTRLIEFDLDNYNLNSTNSSIVSDDLTFTLKNIIFDVSPEGDNIFRLDSKADNKFLSVDLDIVTIDGDNYTILGDELNIRSDITTFRGDLVKFEGDKVEFNFNQFLANVGDIFNLSTEDNTLSFDTDIIKLNAKVNLDIDAVNMELDVASGAEINIKDFIFNAGEDFIKIDGSNNSITLNVDNLNVNANDEGEITFEQLKVGPSSLGSSMDISTGIVNSMGLFTHVGQFETASAHGDGRNTHFRVDIRGNAYIDNSLSIGNESVLSNEKFKIDLEGDKEFIIKEDGSINAFGLVNYFGPNGGKKIERVNVSKTYPDNRLPYVNVVYFFDPNGLQGVIERQFDLPNNAQNGDSITWITTGILHNRARLVLGGKTDDPTNGSLPSRLPGGPLTRQGAIVMGDSEGIMFNVPYASFTLYYYDNGWWLSDLP